VAGLALAALAATGPAAAASGAGGSARTATPIKHVIVIIGENHTFDNVFATYRPPGGQKISNLLSEGIVTAHGGQGPNCRQPTHPPPTNTNPYTLPPKTTGADRTLPQPNTTYVATGCDALPQNSPDTRFPATLANGPYQITKYVPYLDDHSQYTGGCEFTGAFTGDPLHRFYQMWQQTAAHHGRLLTWVANTAGDDNRANPPAPNFH